MYKGAGHNGGLIRGNGMNQPINIIFDGPPDAGQFVEVKTDDGKSINVGWWRKRADGMWALRITELPEVKETETT